LLLGNVTVRTDCACSCAVAARLQNTQRLYDTSRPRGFPLVQDWSRTTAGGKIKVTVQWFLYSSWADLTGLFAQPAHEQLWCVQA
jgi:hypothetical protein